MILLATANSRRPGARSARPGRHTHRTTGGQSPAPRPPPTRCNPPVRPDGQTGGPAQPRPEPFKGVAASAAHQFGRKPRHGRSDCFLRPSDPSSPSRSGPDLAPPARAEKRQPAARPGPGTSADCEAPGPREDSGPRQAPGPRDGDGGPRRRSRDAAPASLPRLRNASRANRGTGLAELCRWDRFRVSATRRRCRQRGGGAAERFPAPAARDRPRRPPRARNSGSVHCLAAPRTPRPGSGSPLAAAWLAAESVRADGHGHGVLSSYFKVTP